MSIPICHPSKETSEKLKLLGAAWAADPARPRIAPQIRTHWEKLIQAWADSNLPLVICNSGGASGEVFIHPSGRKLVYADNSPAQWAFTRAFVARTFSLGFIEHMLSRDEIPFSSFAPKREEESRLTYRRTLGTDGVNYQGWKLCHIDDVGLGSLTPLDETPIEDLKAHFQRLMSPANHFLIPLIWAGLGEVPEVVTAIRDYEQRRRG